jgi:SAM-dependent methyltransferase
MIIFHPAEYNSIHTKSLSSYLKDSMNRDDIHDIQIYYENSVEGEDSRLERHQLERDITWLYFEEYLPKSGNILEIGAATGVHTYWMAQRGYKITAIDLSQNELDFNKNRLAEHDFQHNVETRVRDARDLGDLPENGFDAVLLMGPLYHLVQELDRKLAVEQAVRRLKPGGIFFSSHISRFGILGDLLKNVTGWIEEQDEVHSIIELGRDPENYHPGEFRGYFSTLEEIAPLHEQAGLETIVIAGVEPAISADDQSYNILEGKRRQLWLDLFYSISRVPSMIASSRHILYIGRKPG